MRYLGDVKAGSSTAMLAVLARYRAGRYATGNGFKVGDRGGAISAKIAQRLADYGVEA